MRHDKLERQLDLLLLLADNSTHTAQDLCEKLHISRRNLYYYLEFLRDAGFEVIKSGISYRVSRHSAFFKRLHESIDFTENEAIFMRRILEQVAGDNPLVPTIKTKLDRFYDLSIINDPVLSRQNAHNIEVLSEAIKLKQVVRLIDYSSPHSHTVSDRYVEPFMLLNDNNDVRCYEMISKMNKTFRVSRMKDVKMIDASWGNEDRHREVFTDIFMFSGEEKHRVTATLGQLSYNIMREEYPQATPFITQKDDSKWLLQLDVCSYLGIGRFVLGMFDDITVHGDDAFKQYLQSKIESMRQRMNENSNEENSKI